ncbi:cytochrome P450 [Chondromyces crocatus]|uniref:Cytochrome P450 n=1 Tax=Chondromyces crocatus TaxID=52 RepID=A0A0K1EB47_CHOCO|nr:cytochrome P450 [Chondromyces crocatus]AKT37808.1 cytochrome P450 [Chondromyces crocatus]
MNNELESERGVPAHVPVDLVVDLDVFHPAGMEDDLHLAWRKVQVSGPDIFWTPRNGGHWVATRAEDIVVIQTDHERFSHRDVSIPTARPKGAPTALPVELDPPQHGAYRGLISPAFSIRAVGAMEAKIREVTVALVEAIAPRGECEFVGDFAKELPVVVFLDLVDLPRADRETLLPWAEDLIRPKSAETAGLAYQNLARYVAGWVAQRTERPGNDLISHIAGSRVHGRPITQDEAIRLCMLVLVGGLDTVASMLGFVARFMAQHPVHRRQLAEDPTLLPQAVEELIRRHGLVNTTRTITHDFVFKGVQLKEGERILVPNHLAGLDERTVEAPLTVDFLRPKPAPHAAFGNGPHRCPGSTLARTELRIFLEEWLKRIPEFGIKPGTKPVFASGAVNTVHELHLGWTPARG